MSLQLLIISIVQGLTEFLPVSSSGHIVVLKNLFGLDTTSGPVLEILLHAGTLVSVLVFYWKKIWQLILGVCRGDAASWKYACWLMVATLPAVIVYMLLDDWIDQAFSSSLATGIMMLVTGLLLLSTRLVWYPKNQKPMNFLSSGIIGAAQALAILPGLSRSGSTIAAAKWLKISTQDAFDFSFLMSVPVLLGGVILKIKDIGELASENDCGMAGIVMAFVVSAITGYFALKFIVRCGLKGKFWMFGFYCIIAGILAIVL